jgi:hypothetical protein
MPTEMQMTRAADAAKRASEMAEIARTEISLARYHGLRAERGVAARGHGTDAESCLRAARSALAESRAALDRVEREIGAD